MTHESAGLSRRKFVTAASTGIAGTALAGCLGGGSGSGTTGTLSVGGSSTVYPIANAAAGIWNSNPPSGDKDYWVPSNWGYQTDENAADFFATKYGFEATGKRRKPPYPVRVGLSHSGTGVKGVKNGTLDIGNSSAPVSAELSDASQSTLDKFVDHVIGVDGQPIVVSKEIKEQGVTQITLEELKKIYSGEITNWKAVGGPDKEMLVLGRVKGSGTSTAFRKNVFGDPNFETTVTQRYGKNQQLQTAVSQADNAITYLALKFVQPDGQVPPIGLSVDGKLYEYGKNLGAKEYPLSRDLHMYTWKDTSKKEAAFIHMILSDFGQANFVEPNNYFKLPKDRQKKQLSKLQKVQG
ncbi:MAG: PstS family phosphate ABC transporter substrate-binding protein [Halorientalis sp.]